MCTANSKHWVLRMGCMHRHEQTSEWKMVASNYTVLGLVVMMLHVDI